MLDRVTKIKNACVALVSALLCAGAVILGCTVPVFASSNSGSAGTWVTTGTWTIQHGEISSLIRNSDDAEFYKVPVYIASQDFAGYYITGSVIINNPFTFYLGTTSTVISPSYFESVDAYHVAYSSSTLYVHFTNEFVQTYPILIGYFVVVVPPSTSNSALLVSHNGTVTPSTQYTRLYRSLTSDNMVDNITDAIVNALDMNDVFDILDNIGINSGYLPFIFQNLQTNHNALYQLISSVWNTEQAVLSVNQQTYQAVLGILAHLNNQYGVQESQAEQIADDINQGLGNLAQDMEVVQPSAVADLADNYISQIDTSYNSQVFNFLSNNYIILMLCLVFAFSILSYMLYGGQ